MIHHHSFYYVDQRLFLMQALTWLAGSAATHILLCDRMCQMFERQYPNALRTVAIANAFCVQADTALEALECASSGGRLTIGFLSNLSSDKGVGTFLELAAKARAAGLAVDAVVAGAPQAADDARSFAEMIAAAPYRVHVLGPVHGAAKARFFAMIDVFVFPTRYAHEADPLVVWEALAAGRPVIAYARGCIREQVGDAGLLIEVHQSFVPPALQTVRALLDDPVALGHQQAAARRRHAAVAALGLISSPNASRPENNHALAHILNHRCDEGWNY